MWLELPILCHTDSSRSLEDLGLPSDIDDCEVNNELVNIDKLARVCPYDRDSSKTILEYENGDSILCNMIYRDIKQLIHYN